MGLVVNEFGLAVEVQLVNTVDCRILVEVVVVATNDTAVLSESETSAVVFGANIVVLAVAKHEVQNLFFGKAAIEFPHNRGNVHVRWQS